MATVGSVDLIGGRYRLGALLGRGGMANVYRADDEVLGRAVAVKVFGRDADIPAEEIRQRSEVRLLASLAHPGLVTVFDAGVDTSDPDDPRSYLVLELVDGTALSTQLALGPVPREQVRSLGCQLAAALAYVHGRGIVHRDVKPANILLSSPGTDGELSAKLADFGIARLIDSARITTAGTTVGTANYLSPEQVRGDDIGPASDVYSLGLVLLECLTGSRAYPGVGAEAAVVRLHRPPVIPRRLGVSWLGLLTAMTATDPAQRPSAGEVLRHLTQASSPADCDVPTDHLGPFPGFLWSDTPDADPAAGECSGLRRHAPVVVLAAAVSAAALAFLGYVALGGAQSPGKSATPPKTSVSAPAHHPQAPTTSADAGPATPTSAARVGAAPAAAPVHAAPAAVVLPTRRAAVARAPAKPAKAVAPAKKPTKKDGGAGIGPGPGGPRGPRGGG